MFSRADIWNVSELIRCLFAARESGEFMRTIRLEGKPGGSSDVVVKSSAHADPPTRYQKKTLRASRQVKGVLQKRMSVDVSGMITEQILCSDSGNTRVSVSHQDQ